jgi:transposase
MEAEKQQRYVGIDLGKRTYEMAIVRANGKTEISNGRTSVEGRQSLYRKLRASDKVAMEACSLAFIMAKEMEAAVGCTIRVLNPYHLPLIFGSMKKTDKEDALKLAHLLEDYRDEHLPLVSVPSDKEMGQRKILASYRREVEVRTQAINRLHALFVTQGITGVVKKDLATDGRRQETIQGLRGHERGEAEHLVLCLQMYEGRIQELEEEMRLESAGNKEVERLRKIPGVGPKVAFAFTSYVAAERFENVSQISNYLGLAPRVYISGQAVRYGGITKRGNGYLRALLVQAAWALVRSKNGGRLKERYKYMTQVKGIGKKKAIVAIARRLAELMYTLMKNGSEYEVLPFNPPKQDRSRGLMYAAEAALSA